MDIQLIYIKNLRKFLIKIKNLNKINFLFKYRSINCAQYCDGSPTEFCESILEGILSEGIFKPMSKLIEVYKNSPSVNYVPQIPFESFFSRSLSNSLRSISD
jgi:hypothetical protein